MAGSENGPAIGGKGSAFRLGSLTTLRSNAFDLVVALLFLNVLGLVMPMSLLQVYDRILPNKSIGTMVLLLLGVLGALFLEALRPVVGDWLGGGALHRPRPGQQSPHRAVRRSQHGGGQRG
ncbi:MAG TPA: hypothetical protein VK196_19810 [Magnetospirillum sp.]|nr:hypothetical protein [Magnetospirillum sp.]